MRVCIISQRTDSFLVLLLYGLKDDPKACLSIFRGGSLQSRQPSFEVSPRHEKDMSGTNGVCVKERERGGGWSIRVCVCVVSFTVLGEVCVCVSIS